MKTVQDSLTIQNHIIHYQHLNGKGRLFGGELMAWIDEVAGTVGMRHAGCEVMTAAVDTLVFKAPAFLNDLVLIQGRVTYVGNTSMEVRVETFVHNPDKEKILINRAYFVMVALDDEGVPTKIPPISLSTTEDEVEWTAGEKRHALRKQRRKENF